MMDEHTSHELAYKKGYEDGKPKWIPVTERLPKPGKWVLCACRANIIEVLSYDSTMGYWDSIMPEWCYMKGFVTHWMPLPTPPKGE